MTKQAWHIARKRGIGASEIGAVMGIDKYKTALDIYLDKIDPEIKELPDNENMRRGREKEPLVVQRFAARHPEWIIHEPEGGSEYNILFSSERPYCFATPDRMITALQLSPKGALEEVNCVLECKHTRRQDAFKWRKGDIPAEYFSQVQWQLYCTGLQTAFFAWIYESPTTGEENYYEIRVERDDDFIAIMTESADNFWLNHVEPKVLPEGAPVIIEATTQAHDWWAELDSLQIERKFIEEREKELKSLLQEYMKDSTVLAVDGRPIATWKRAKPTEKVDKALLKSDYPEAYGAAVYLEQGSRRFCLVREKAKEVEVGDE